MAAIFYYYSALKAKFEDRERGATAVEYGVMVAFIALAIIVAVTAFGKDLSAMFDRAGEGINPTL